jgi:23S rRNA pseudouridine2457 synthase
MVTIGDGGETPRRYVALYKPYSTLTSFEDDTPKALRTGRERRQTLRDLSLPAGLHTVGRLDRDSEGLLLLTDDGDFCNRVLQGGVRKRYLALVLGHPTEDALAVMARGGLNIRGRLTRPALVRCLQQEEAAALQQQLPPPHPQASVLNAGNSCWLELLLMQGLNRQVRRTTQSAGHHTVRLVRMGIGALHAEQIGLLQPGEWSFVERWAVIDPSTELPRAAVTDDDEFSDIELRGESTRDLHGACE